MNKILCTVTTPAGKCTVERQDGDFILRNKDTGEVTTVDFEDAGHITKDVLPRRVWELYFKTYKGRRHLSILLPAPIYSALSVISETDGISYSAVITQLIEEKWKRDTNL